MARKLKNEELDRLTPETFKNAEKTPLMVILENVRSMHNVGTIFRTCDAFRIEALYLTGYTGQPPHRDILKTALGATESVHWEHFKDPDHALDKAEAEGRTIHAVEQTMDAIPLHTLRPDLKKPHALVFGNEVEGVTQKTVDRCHKAIDIPQFGTKHSFNIAVGAGIVLWEFIRGRIDGRTDS